MEFEEFATRAEAIEDAAADTAVRDLLAALFEDAGEDLPVVARFVQGRVFPAWDSTTLDVGPAALHEAIARAAGPNVSPEDVERRLAEVGEIGAVAAGYDLGGQTGLDAFTADEESGVTVAEVDRTLRSVAAAEGAGSQDRKVSLMFDLFNRASSGEARYLARIVLSEMRIGVGEGTVRDAVAEAFAVPESAVERALQVSNDYGRVAEIARDRGESGLAELGLAVGRPVQAMLAQAGTVEEAIDAWEGAAVEVKYDGARLQVHWDGTDVALFSRNMEAVTDALPEVVETVRDRVDAPAILDGEVVAVDGNEDPLPFQAVLRRLRRKHDVERAREDVTVRFRAFDCLHAPAGDRGPPDADPPGVDLLDAPLRERRRHLRSVADDAVVTDLHVENDPDAIADHADRALAAGHEGIMLKDPDSTYTPGKRGKKWLKRKPEVETLDLVVVGAEWGEGRRANQFGTFRLAARSDDGLVPVGNVATGITEEKLAELTDLLEPYVTGEEGRTVDLEPAVVFEVGYEEIQASPTYESGFALRFPRFEAVRHDVDPDDADSLSRIRRLADPE